MTYATPETTEAPAHWQASASLTCATVAVPKRMFASPWNPVSFCSADTTRQSTVKLWEQKLSPGTTRPTAYALNILTKRDSDAPGADSHSGAHGAPRVVVR